ncbi:MAG: hypothetical protein CSA15_12960 [Candidatus Delongbacteria bacterium]|nr:MAG: hypothetical protein CSA15_12960 [Candidatus Delongbacteria bacterium]
MKNKYLVIAQKKIKQTFIYRTNLIFTFLGNFVSFLPIILIFLTLGFDQYIGDYSGSDLVFYYTLSLIVSSLTYPNVRYEIVNDIYSGNLNNILILPFNYNIYIVIETLISNLIFMVTTLFFTSILFITHYIDLGTISLQNCLFFIVFILFSTSLSIILGSLFSITAFWTERVYGFAEFLEYTIPLTMGSILPLSLFPNIVEKVLLYLPFSYLSYIPVNIMLDKFSIDEIFQHLYILLFWNLILSSFYLYLWKKGLKAYRGVGG